MTGSRAQVRARVEAWIADDPEPADRAELQALLDAGADTELAERFADRLHFGTAGLRGPLRAGPAGMNRAVVGRAAAGLAAYLPRGATVVIGYDARHGSSTFARDTAQILAGAGARALLLPRALPTPVLAFAVRHLAAEAGVMVTASHNPPGDNGYKVYLGGASLGGDGPGRGAQIVPPADAGIEAAIEAVTQLREVPRSEAYDVLGEAVLEAYYDALAAVPRGPARELRVAYTPLHGVGAPVLVEAFRRAGFAEPAVVPEQAEPDPDFPTVAFPNPEEPGALDLAQALATRVGADLVIANDPDADRCAVAVEGRILTGDELGVLLADHLLRNGIQGRYATTIVSSSLLEAMCAAHGMPFSATLTGFKWIVRSGTDLVFGYEEALGYAVAPGIVRDKDGISAALLIAELAATLKAAGSSLLQRLGEIEARYGVHATGQVSVRVQELDQIGALMARLRSEPPQALAGRPIASVEDLLPEADVLRLRAEGIRVVVRPSGTEPKLKAYLQAVEHGPRARTLAAERLEALRSQIAELFGQES